MPTLREIQQQFAAAVYQSDTSLEAHICETDGISAHDRLAIYRSSATGIQSDALASVYPVIQELVGEKFFFSACKQYLREHPSPSGDLHNLGESVAQFLRDYPPAQSLPYLPDIATLEWAAHISFHAKNEEGFDFEAFAQIPPEEQNDLVFYLRHSAHLIDSPWPISRVWAMHQPNYEDDGETIDLDSGGERVLVYRLQRQIEITTVSDEQWLLLSSIQEGSTLGDLLQNETLAKHIPELLPLCIQNGWIARFNLQAN